MPETKNASVIDPFKLPTMLRVVLLRKGRLLMRDLFSVKTRCYG
jgi:hypothetical protein